ncbi:MAG: hypothetical protein QOE58_1259, partial [Actinomycetota bacterium]|nr:hypothetical protein [Actinomycetota bacterium]
MAQLSPTTGMVLFSARGRHPDATLTVDSARARGSTHLGVVSSRTRGDLPASLGADDVRVGTVPTPSDGFLATNSLLAMATALCLAHGVELPPTLPSFDLSYTGTVSRTCVALTGPGVAAVGVDLEARLVEPGLATVQLADYRNFAHGRHVGLFRNISDFTVIGVIDPASSALADRTLALLPRAVDIVELRTELEWPASVLDLLVRSMHLTAAIGRDRGVDPGRPGVQPFGRRLYHLPVARLLRSPPGDPVARKLIPASGPGRAAYEVALAEWLRVIGKADIGALVLDYDGTCCPTWDRYRAPPEAAQHEILRLLDAGLVLGFATGRGRSLHDTTRSWMPERFWSKVHVGLYNGTCMLTLADDPPDSAGCDGMLAAAADRLESLGLGAGLVVERRRTQVSVSTSDGGLRGSQLLELVRSTIARPPVLQCKALASGHSVDLVAANDGKVSVLKAVTGTNGVVLAIGD